MTLTDEESLAFESEDERSWAEVSVQEGMDLAVWGLPDLVLRQYYAQGIHKLFHWQVTIPMK